MKTIIIGMGNPIVSDDRIGIYISERLKEDISDVKITKASFSGFYLLDLILEYDRVIFIDSIITDKNDIGDVNVYQLADFEQCNPFSIHSTDLLSAIDTCKKFDMEIPEQYYFITVEINDNVTFSEAFTDEIESRKEKIYETVKEKVGIILK